MDANELLKTWPTWSHANAETVLASPAWRMPVSVDGRSVDMRLEPVGSAADEILLGVKFEDEPHVLGIRDSEMFPDLHLLWARRQALDPNLLLALVERECGSVFQMLENVVRREFSIDGLRDAVPADGERRVFVAGDVSFSLDLSAALTMQFGQLDFLDPSHESIRSLTREARLEYGHVALAGDELAGLAEGDLLILPEGFQDGAHWTVDPFSDTEVHVCAASTESFAFAQFADDSLPAPPEPAALVLMNGSRTLAEGECATIGGCPCFRLTHLHS